MSQPPDEEYDDDFEDDEEVEEGEYDEADEDDEADPAQAALGEDGGAEEGDEHGEEEEDEEDDDEEDAQPWQGLRSLGEKDDLVQLFREARASGRKQLTVLLLGKSGVGKSSTINSLLGEQVVRVQPFKLQADTEITSIISRQVDVGDANADGFKLKLIDTCGLEDPEAGDTVNYAALQKIAEDIKGVPIDVVLYVDRLDLYRIEPLDKSILEAISAVLGKRIWKKTILVFTHANLAQTPPGTSYETFADRRVRMLRSNLRKLVFRPALPAVLVENSDTCPVNDAGHKTLPDESEWLITLMSDMVDMGEKAPYKYQTRYTRRPNDRFKLLIPFVAFGQYVLWTKVLKPLLDADEKRAEELEDEVWARRIEGRRKLGLHAPTRTPKELAWRCEHGFDDE